MIPQCKRNEKILYSNSKGTISNVTLSESCTNFETIKIYYYFCTSDVKHYGVKEIQPIISSRFSLFEGVYSDTKAVLFGVEILTIATKN